MPQNLSDDDLDTIVDLGLARKKGERLQRIGNGLISGFVAGAIGMAESRCFQENVEDIVFNGGLAACLVTGAAYYFLERFVQKQKHPWPEECDRKMFSIAARNPGFFKDPVHKYPDTPLKAAGQTPRMARN